MSKANKTLLGSVSLLATSALFGWFVIEHNLGQEQPESVHGAPVPASLEHREAAPARADTRPARLDPRDPQTRTATVFRWTDESGATGYSEELPARVTSFKVIVLPQTGGQAL